MSDPLDELRAAALAEIAAVPDEQALDAVRVRYLGRKREHLRHGASK